MSKQSTMDLFRRPEPTGDPVREPAFWIEEVRLLKSYSPDPNEQIREPITFLKGLNIIWAPAPEMDDRKEVNFAGHSAGKTTLCRLLRYLLGEQNIAEPDTKDSIEETFPLGWIAGKIHVENECWVVARPLHHRARPRGRCLKSNSIDELLEERDKFLPIEEFNDALTEATVVNFPVEIFGDGKTAITFAHLLQWLTRDQEHHLSKLHAFRHPDSHSGPPDLSAVPAYFLQRVVLNLADVDLQKSITACEKLEKEEKLLPVDEAYFVRREHELNQFLKTEGIKKEGDSNLTALQIEPTRKTVVEIGEAKTKTVRDAIELAEERLDELDEVLPELRENLGKVKANVEVAKSAVTDAEEKLAVLEGRKLNLKVEKDKAKMRLPADYCRVPREEAKGCQLFRELEALTLNEFEAGNLLEVEKKEASDEITKCEKNLKQLKTIQTENENKIEAATKEKEKIEAKIKDLQKKLRELRTPFTTINSKIDDLETVIENLREVRLRKSNIEEEVKAAKALQEDLQERHKQTENDFVDEFSWTVGQIFAGEGTIPQCKFTREQISTSVTYHGKDLKGSAVAALGYLCFDIAAMVFSCRGRGFHPRFLIHDSPREADMGPAPYGRYFDRIVKQAKENPNFQHIVTTTTAPPKEYRGLPHTRLILDSTRSEGRLFKQDL